MSHEPGHAPPGQYDDSYYGTEEESSYLGVPDDFVVNRTPVARNLDKISGAQRRFVQNMASQPIEVRPRYEKGDEWRLANRFDPATIAEIQVMMAAADLYPDNAVVTTETWDPATAKAFKKVLEYANGTGFSWQTALRQMASGDAARVEDGQIVPGGPGGTIEPGEVDITKRFTPPPLRLRTTNKTDLRQVFRQAVIDTLGEGWSRDEINELVDAYNWQEIRLQVDAYHQEVDNQRREFEAAARDEEQLAAAERQAAEGEDVEVTVGDEDEGGGVISEVAVPSPAAFAEEQMIERDPVGYGSGRIVNEFVPALFDMLGGWGSRG